MLLCVAALSIGAAIVTLAQRRDPMVSFATRERVRLRSAADPKRAHAAQLAALKVAWPLVVKGKTDVDADGKVEGAALEKAHGALTAFYKHDEAFAFDLWYTSSKARKVLVVYFEARSTKEPIWLALDGGGHEVHLTSQLPRGAFVAMKHAAE